MAALLQVPGVIKEESPIEEEDDETETVTVVIDNGTYSLKYGIYNPERHTFPDETASFFIKKDFGETYPLRYYRGKCFPLYKSQLINNFENWELLLLLYKDILSEVSKMYDTNPKNLQFNILLTEHPSTVLMNEFKKSKTMKLEKLFEFDERINAIHIADTAMLSLYAANAKPEKPKTQDNHDDENKSHSNHNNNNNNNESSDGNFFDEMDKKQLSPIISTDSIDVSFDVATALHDRTKDVKNQTTQNSNNTNNNTNNTSNNENDEKDDEKGKGSSKEPSPEFEELTGLVVDIGHHSSYVCPVHGGHSIKQFCYNFSLSGEDITLNINHFINKSLELKEIKSQYNDSANNSGSSSGNENMADEFSTHDDIENKTNGNKNNNNNNSDDNNDKPRGRSRGQSSAVTMHHSKHRDSSYIYNYNEFDRLTSIDRIKCHGGDKEYPQPFCMFHSLYTQHRRSSSLLLNVNPNKDRNLKFPKVKRRQSRTSRSSWTSTDSRSILKLLQETSEGKEDKEDKEDKDETQKDKGTGKEDQKGKKTGKEKRRSKSTNRNRGRIRNSKKTQNRLSLLDTNSFSNVMNNAKTKHDKVMRVNSNIITFSLPIGQREDCDNITVKLTNSSDKFEDACEILFDPSKAFKRKTRDKTIYPKKNPIQYPNYIVNKGIHLIILKCILETCDIGINMDLHDKKPNYTIVLTNEEKEEKKSDNNNKNKNNKNGSLNNLNSASSDENAPPTTDLVKEKISYKSVPKVNEAGLREMEHYFSNIILSGGTTTIDGFDQRIKEELDLLINGEFKDVLKKLYPKYNLKKNVKIRVYGMRKYEHRRKFHAFYGGCHYIAVRSKYDKENLIDEDDNDESNDNQNESASPVPTIVDSNKFWITRDDYDKWDENELERYVTRLFW